MKRETALTHEFVEYIPERLKDRTVYVSIPFATAAHKCCCGCGKEVVTPLTPTDWQLTFDGETISLEPSIGNWSFACQSHYWITRNELKWAPRWSQKEIASGRSQDKLTKERYFDEPEALSGATVNKGAVTGSLWRRLTNWWHSSR